MKRFLTYAALTLILLAAVTTAAFPQFITNSLNHARLQATAWVFTVVQTFNAAIDVSGSDIAVDEGQRFDMEGLTGDTYTTRTADTDSVDIYNDGVLVKSIRGDQESKAPCPADLATVSQGSECYEASTGVTWHKGERRQIP